jgi:hypothetical protein
MNRTITITYNPGSCGGWDVEENGKTCDGLCWDEMLGQIAAMTVPPGRVGHGYPMRTPQEWVEHRQRMAGKHLQQAVPPLQIAGPATA